MWGGNLEERRLCKSSEWTRVKWGQIHTHAQYIYAQCYLVAYELREKLQMTNDLTRCSKILCLV